MPLTFPYSVATFADVIRMSTVRFQLVADQQISGRGGGKIIVADMGPKYWQADVTLINMEHGIARQMQALIEALDESINDFYLYDPRWAYPAEDWGGSRVGPAVVTIGTLNPNNKEMTLSGLPNGYVLTPGDMLHFDFGVPSKRALHRIVVGGVAAGGSVGIEVRPHIEPGATTGLVVSLIKPSARMKIIPGSFDPGTARGMITSGMGFKCRQV